jgi:hypothetical protein
MKENKVLLFLTATVRVPQVILEYDSNYIENEKLRLNQYLEALKLYSQCKNVDTVVFMENSNYLYGYSQIKKLYKKVGKNLIIVKYNGIVNVNKNHGELEMMMKLPNYVNIDEFSHILKLTGRIQIPELDLVIEGRLNKNLYSNYLYSGVVETWINLYPVEIYKQVISFAKFKETSNFSIGREIFLTMKNSGQLDKMKLFNCEYEVLGEVAESISAGIHPKYKFYKEEPSAV